MDIAFTQQATRRVGPIQRTTNTGVFTPGVVEEHEEPNDYCGEMVGRGLAEDAPREKTPPYADARCTSPPGQR
jgi:hypothetical protein